MNFLTAHREHFCRDQLILVYGINTSWDGCTKIYLIRSHSTGIEMVSSGTVIYLHRCSKVGLLTQKVCFFFFLISTLIGTPVLWSYFSVQQATLKLSGQKLNSDFFFLTILRPGSQAWFFWVVLLLFVAPARTTQSVSLSCKPCCLEALVLLYVGLRTHTTL